MFSLSRTDDARMALSPVNATRSNFERRQRRESDVVCADVGLPAPGIFNAIRLVDIISCNISMLWPQPMKLFEAVRDRIHLPSSAPPRWR
jgi:hypothetical protein